MKKIFAILFVLAFTVPSYSAVTLVDDGNKKFSLYGSVRLLGLYQNVNTNGSTQSPGSNDLVYNMQGNSRLGLDFSIGNFFSKAEFRFTADDNADAGVFRQLYVGYKFNNGLEVLVGRTNSTSETYLWYDNVFDSDDGMKGYGTMGVGRQNMLRLSMKNVHLSFIALKDADKNKFALSGDGFAVEDEVMPAIELSYSLDFGKLTGNIFAFYSGITVGTERGQNALEREWIQSASAGFVLSYEVVGVTTVLSAFYALNGDFIGAIRWGSASLPNKNSPQYDKDGKWDGYNDINTWGAALSIGYKIMDSLDVTIGGGYQSTFAKDSAAFDSTGSLNSYSAYLAFRYNINEYFMLIPTVGYYVIDSANEENPFTEATFIAGTQLRINF